MPMEKFVKKGGKYKDPFVTITASGQIGLSSSCMERYFKGCKHALLFGDKKNKTIGIMPIDSEQGSSYKISFSKNRATGSISGHSLLGYFGLTTKNSARYVPVWDAEEKMLLINLGGQI